MIYITPDFFFLDEVYQAESEEYYHHYKFVEVGQPSQVISGLELIFVELPKFKALEQG